MLPHKFFDLPLRERAFIIGSIDLRIENEKERRREAERKVKQVKGRRK